MTPTEALMVSAWAMDSHALRGVLSTAERVISTPRALGAYLPRRLAGADRATARNSVAVVTAAGPLFKREGLLTTILGGTAYETLRRDFQAAIDNPLITAILLNVDSPGGEAAGVGELAAAVASFRGTKPIVAYAGDLAASAGYWLASAADSIVIGPGAALGSIGVRATYADTSARDAARGVKPVEFVSSQSPFKKSDLGTDDGRNRIQARVDALAQVFVDTVASNRGVSVEHVLAAFGKGDVLIGQSAVAAGMADAIGTFESTLAKLAKGTLSMRRPPPPKSLAPRVGMPVAPLSVSKLQAPIPARPAAPVVSQAVAADRARAIELIAMTAKGVAAEAECQAAIRMGVSVESYKATVAARSVLDALIATQVRRRPN